MATLTTTMEIGLYPEPAASFKVFDNGSLILEYTLNLDYSVSLSQLSTELVLTAEDFQEEVYNLGRWRRAVMTAYQMSPWPPLVQAVGAGPHKQELEWKRNGTPLTRVEYDGSGVVKVKPRRAVDLTWSMFNAWLDVYQCFAQSISEGYSE